MQVKFLAIRRLSPEILRLDFFFRKRITTPVYALIRNDRCRICCLCYFVYRRLTYYVSAYGSDREWVLASAMMIFPAEIGLPKSVSNVSPKKFLDASCATPL